MKTVKSPFSFPGGVHPRYNKAPTENQPIETLPLPGTLVLSLRPHLGASAKCLVKAGDRVVKGQRIGEKNGFISAHVHASASGTVKAVETRTGASGQTAEAVILETDAACGETAYLPPLDARTASREALLARIEEAGICGMGGAGFPTAVKLDPPPPRTCEYLIVNGAECEPYLTADHRVMIEQAARIRKGVEIMCRILKEPAVRVAVEDNKPQAITALEKAFADFPGDAALVVLPTRYPQGSEKHQIYATVGRVVPDGELPIAVGCVVENVSTAVAIADAVEYGWPLIQRVTTVTGDGIARPKNVRVPSGTRYADLAAFCGGEKGHVKKVVSGGPMMGFTVSHLDIPTTKTTSGVLFLTDKSVFQYASAPCIGCGRCLRACPMRLDPSAISTAMEAGDAAGAEACGVMNCLECGACAYVCPAYRSLTHLCRRAKISIRARIAAEKANAEKKG